MSLADKLKDLRKTKQVSQEKFAEYLGVTYQAVSKWENGITSPDISLLPDGFTVSGGRRDLYLPHLSMHSDATASVTFTITAGEHVDAVNRPVLEVIAQGRPTAGYLPVVLLG